MQIGTHVLLGPIVTSTNDELFNGVAFEDLE